MVKNSPANAGDAGSIPVGKIPREGNANSTLSSFWEILMDRGASMATVLGVVKELEMT